jgi:hypothetical protein
MLTMFWKASKGRRVQDLNSKHERLALKENYQTKVSLGTF